MRLLSERRNSSRVCHHRTVLAQPQKRTILSDSLGESDIRHRLKSPGRIRCPLPTFLASSALANTIATVVKAIPTLHT